MKILVIGAGYIGKALMQQWKGPTFLATTTSKEKKKELESLADQVFFIDRNTNLKPIISLCDGIVVTVAPKSGFSYYETYYETAMRIAEGTVSPKRLFYTSSTSVYSSCHDEWVEEEFVCNPTDEKSQILLDTEKVYLDSPFLQSTILRLGGIYGPGRTIENRARYFCGKGIDNPNQPTNNSSQEDIINAIIFAYENDLKGIYNVVEDYHPTRRELYDSLCSKLKLPLPQWDNSTTTHKPKISNQKIKNAGFFFTTLQPKGMIT